MQNMARYQKIKLAHSDFSENNFLVSRTKHLSCRVFFLLIIGRRIGMHWQEYVSRMHVSQCGRKVHRDKSQ